jgi:NH3-dependent NAD+ synthetase
VDAILNSLENPTEQTIINLPPRIRMSTLYAVSQSMNGRVANTCNLSEDWVGYSTRYGDSVGDFSPCSNITVTEMKQIGHYLGLPYELVEKIPADGLCNKTDEDNLGFTYAELDKYIREGIEPENPATKERIDNLHVKNLFKLRIMPSYNPVETKKAVLIYTDGYSIETTDCESIDEAVILMEKAYNEAKCNQPDCEPIEDYCNDRSACFADGDTYRLWSIHES